jgi:hypothetical protein
LIGRTAALRIRAPTALPTSIASQDSFEVAKRGHLLSRVK